MTGTALLTLRIHRFEVISMGAAALVTIAAAIVAAWHLDAVGLPPGCFQAYETGISLGTCARLMETFSQAVERTRPLLAAVAVIPVATGLFLGAPVVAREIERGTTRLAWSLAPSRFGWFVSRVVPLLGFVVLLAAAIGISADRYLAARSPDLDMNAAFYDYGLRGVLVPARAALVFGAAVAAGAVLGRLLPAILVAAVLSVALLLGVQVVHERVLEREAVVITEQALSGRHRYVDTVFQLPDGTIIRSADAMVEFHDDGTQTIDGLEAIQLARAIPGERYPEVAAREALGVAVLTVGLLAVSAMAVARRRPG